MLSCSMASHAWKGLCDAELPHPSCSLVAWVLTETLAALDPTALASSLQPAKLQAGESESPRGALPSTGKMCKREISNWSAFLLLGF